MSGKVRVKNYLLKITFCIIIYSIWLIFLYPSTNGNRIGSWIFYDETNIINYEDTEWNNFEAWTITISDGENTITMLDRNLWATSNNPKSYCSHWYYYQRWNNYWFPLENYYTQWGYTGENCNSEPIWLHTNWWKWYFNLDYYLSFDPIDWSHEYLENDYYSKKFRVQAEAQWAEWTDNQIFYWNREYYLDAKRWRYWTVYWQYNWSIEQRAKLRWWEYDNKNNMRNYWKDKTKRQWPCPIWYHIPSEWEFNKLINVRINIKDDIVKDKISYWEWWEVKVEKIEGSNWFDIFDDFKFPYYAWYLGGEWSIWILNYYFLNDSSVNWYYRSSSFDNYPRRLAFDNDGGFGTYISEEMIGMPIRCFKDEPIDLSSLSTSKTYTLTINYQYEWWFVAKPTETQVLYEWDFYSIISPQIDWYTADQTMVSWTMLSKDTTITVTYTKNPNSDWWWSWWWDSSGTETIASNLKIYADSNAKVNERIELTINTNSKYTWKINFTNIQYFTSSQGRINIEKTSKYISSYSSYVNSSYTMTSSERWTKTFSNFIKFAIAGKYRIYVEDEDWSETKYVEINVTNSSSDSDDTDNMNETLELTTNRKSPTTDQFINLTITTDDDYTWKIGFSKFQYRSSSSSSWNSISRTSSTYVSDYSSDWADGYYRMTSSDDGEATLKNLVKFKKTWYYRIYVEDADGNEDYVQINVEASNSSSSNDNLEVYLSPSSPDIYDWIKLTIETDDDYTDKINFSKFQYRFSSSSSWSNISRTSSVYVSDYSDEWSDGYYKMTSSDDGEAVLKNLVKFKKSGYYRIYIEDADDNETYVQINVSDDNWNDSESNSNSELSLSANDNYPYTNKPISITIKTEGDYSGKIKLYAKYKDSSGNRTKISNTSSTYFSDYSSIWENGYYNMKSSDKWKKILSDLMEFKKEWVYRIYAEDEQWYSNYISVNVTSSSNTKSSNNSAVSNQVNTTETDDIDKLISQLLWNDSWVSSDINNDIERNKNNLKGVSDEIYKSRSCKEYRIQYNVDLWVFTSPDLKKKEFFVNKEYLKRYIDSKNPQKDWCPVNSWWITTIYRDKSSNNWYYISPNWKVYFISFENWYYFSDDLTVQKKFSTISEIKYYIRDRNPLIWMQ